MSRYAAVVFDLDGTLCRHDQDVETVFYDAFREIGTDPVGTPGDLWSAMRDITAFGTERDQLADAMERLAADRDRSLDVDAWVDAFRARLDWTDVSLLSGATAALTAARTNGPVGLLTNGPESRQSTKLTALGLDDAFDAIVYAGDMDRRKPAPDPFERVLALLGTSASETLYVGNSLEYDVAGARAAGLPVAWIGDGDTSEYDPDHMLHTVGGLSSVLGR